MSDITIEIVEQQDCVFEIVEETPIELDIREWGEKWDAWASVVEANFVGNDIVFIKDDWSEVVLEDAKDSLKWVWISSIVKTWTNGLVDTYTITYTDNTTATFEITNWEDWEDWEDWSDWKSAYQIWLDEGNTWTEQDFIDSLKWDSFEWPASATDDNLVVFDWDTWTKIKDWGKKITDLQEKLIEWENITIEQDWKTIKAKDTTYSASDFDIKDLLDSDWLRDSWDSKLGIFNRTTLKNERTTAPILYDTTNDYTLWEYTYWATKLYRKVPVVYSSANDIFYSDDTMTVVVAKRDLILN